MKFGYILDRDSRNKLMQRPSFSFSNGKTEDLQRRVFEAMRMQLQGGSAAFNQLDHLLPNANPNLQHVPPMFNALRYINPYVAR